MRVDPRERIVICATALIGSGEKIVGIGAIDVAGSTATRRGRSRRVSWSSMIAPPKGLTTCWPARWSDAPRRSPARERAE
jgi:hypothetical protein